MCELKEKLGTDKNSEQINQSTFKLERIRRSFDVCFVSRWLMDALLTAG